VGADAKWGVRKTKKIVCVHILLVIYQLCLLCFDGLADNFDDKLSHHWRRISPQIKFKTSLLTILSSCQQNIPQDESISIDELLQNFSVGTERANQIIHRPCSLDNLLPFRDLDMRSVHKKAGDCIERRTNTGKNSVSDLIDD
jgi:hypothetical protein